MNAAAAKHEWTAFLKFYGEQNQGRLTRLGVFESNNDVVTDYWLESGLPLVGIDLSDKDGGGTVIQVMVGEMTHDVSDPRSLNIRFTAAGDEDGIDITDADGRITVLRFESSEPRD